MWRLAWPVSFGMLATMGMGVVDTLLVGHLGEAPMASVSLASGWFYAVGVLAMGTLRALDPLVSQAHGAGDRGAIERALSNGFVLSAILVVPFAAAMLASGPGLRLLGQPEALVPLSQHFTRVMALGVPGLLGFSTLRAVQQGTGMVRPATAVLLLANGLNAILGYTLVYVLGMGVIGCAWSTAVCNWFLFFSLAAITPELRPRVRPDLRAVGRLLRLGAPLGLQMGIETWAFVFAGLMMGWVGSTALAAHAIVMNLATLSFMVPLGVSAAAATRVGNLIGAGEPWQRAANVSLALGAAVMSVSALIFFLLPVPLAGLYNDDRAVTALAASLLPIAAGFQLFDGLQVVAFGVLRGAGDLKLPALANIVGFWLIGLPIGAWLAFRAGWGASGIWTGMLVGLACVAGLLLARVRWTIARGGFKVSS